MSESAAWSSTVDTLRTFLNGRLGSGMDDPGRNIPPALEPWLDRIREVGPSSRSGAPSHDLVVPSERAAGPLGINIFQHEPVPGLADFVEGWAAEHLGAATAAALRTFRDALPAGVRMHPGAHCDAGRLRLKLYLSAAPGPKPHALLLPVAEGLGVHPDALPPAPEHAPLRALAVDLDAQGLTRPRAYRLLLPDDPELPALGDAAARWMRVSAGPTGHRILASLGSRSHPASKRSLVRTFAPGDREDALNSLHRGLEAEGLPSGHDPWFVAAWYAVSACRRTLRPAAHELDLYPDGRMSTDLFVTLAEAE